MKRILNVVATSLIFTGALGSPVVLAWDNGNDNAHNKVTICHATGSKTNPFVKISPNANGVINGHVGHQDGDDIIPPFAYNSHGIGKHFAGQNWDAAGQAIFNNGCKVPTGGRGGEVTPPTTGGQGSGVTPASTTPAQVQAPAGAVNAGDGSASQSAKLSALLVTLGSISVLGLGLRRLNENR